jgi:hypothetical protein
MDDGRHDFDFLAGTWHVSNRTLKDTTPGAPGTWLEFESTATSRPVLNGLGNIDEYHVADHPSRDEYWGFALRLFEPETGLWRIWWASNPGRGTLDPPVSGRFVGGEGHFEGDDVVAEQEVKVRFRWSDITPDSARWEQSFSFDGGRSFAPNWVMSFRRAGQA